MIFLDSLGKISYNLNNLNMNYVSGTVLKDLGKVPCIYFGDRTQEKRIWKFNFPNPFLPTYGFKLQTKLRAFFRFDLVTLFPLHG